MDTDAILGLLQEAHDEVIAPRFRALDRDDVDTKSGPHDLVTIADKECEEYLTRRLQDAHPSAVVIGEETAFANPEALRRLRSADHAFVIDPIDGTGNFVRGRETYGVMLAEVKAGQTTRGWIWQPQVQRAYVAEHGAGVLLNGKQITRTEHDRLPLGATSKKQFVGFDADGALSPAIFSFFSAAFDYPAVLAGELDFMYYTSTYPWDHLAGSLMLRENGGVSRSLDGNDYSIASTSSGLLIAGTEALWQTASAVWPSSASVLER